MHHWDYDQLFNSMIDLHCHSNFSDGELSPKVLLDRALQKKLQILALTDHDTTAGLDHLKAAARNKPIRIINGVELSVRWKKYDIHVIGLNIRPRDPVIQALLCQQADRRIDRALQIAEKLKFCGIDNAYAKACKLAGHERLGRPHFAQLLLHEGLVANQQFAFRKFLGRGKPAYVVMQWVEMAKAVAVINQCQGQAVLAHPLKYGLTNTKLYELIRAFKAAGGVGIEVVSGEVTAAQVEELAALSLRFQLFASTGSDYHSDGASRVLLGEQYQLPVNCNPIWQQWTC